MASSRQLRGLGGPIARRQASGDGDAHDRIECVFSGRLLSGVAGLRGCRLPRPNGWSQPLEELRNPNYPRYASAVIAPDPKVAYGSEGERGGYDFSCEV